jgi:Leucine-rich repeat (LRR) protein
MLQLNRCDLSSLPVAALCVVAPRIQALHVGANSLRSLPGALLERCTALRQLRCDFNQLESLPAEIGACTALQELDCIYNKLSVLPAELGACVALQELRCRHNRLSSLPAELGTGCISLWGLDCRHNQLSSLPVQLGLLNSLHVLECDGNPFTEGAPTSRDELRAAALTQSGRRTKRATPGIAGSDTTGKVVRRG